MQDMRHLDTLYFQRLNAKKAQNRAFLKIILHYISLQQQEWTERVQTSLRKVSN